MQPTKQTKLGWPFGNCFYACIATIFEIPLAKIPNMNTTRNNTDNDWWFDDFSNWLQRVLGITPVCLVEELPTNALCIASGPAKRGLLHSVVWQSGRMIFDPHPDDSGLISVNDYIYFIVHNPADVFRTYRGMTRKV